MVSSIHSVAFSGMHATPVEVQVQLLSGLPNFIIVGLPDKAIGESKERVRAAITSLGLALPAQRIIVNLAPADLAKEGSHFDLPIALALLQAMKVINFEYEEPFWAMGELSLDGRLVPVNGVLPATMAAGSEGAGMICPAKNGAEAAWAGDDIPILATDSLLSLINHLKGTQLLPRPKVQHASGAHNGPDLKDVKGQMVARRALEIAAAGGHNMLMSGPPGSGKSMLARCLPSILPPLSIEEILEVSTIASIAGCLEEGELSDIRPYRDPHHTSSMPAMVGGGKRAKPGEISLAHRGVLFMDELPEYPRGVLESLRQPLEEGTVSVARAEAHVTYPANVQLVAAMNPCRCGYLTDPARACNKAPRCAEDYVNKLSGPLLDRIDMFVDVPAVDTLSMLNMPKGEASQTVKARVIGARQRQSDRYLSNMSSAQNRNTSKNARRVRLNSDADVSAFTEGGALPDDTQALLETAVQKLNLSMRGYTRTLRVARTIADLAGSQRIEKDHLAEALTYRQN